MLIIGIDPGVSNGIAIYKDGKLDRLETHTVSNIIEFLKIVKFNKCKVIIEDSRLQSYLFTGSASKRHTALKIARDVGGVDMICRIIESICLIYDEEFIAISPKSKGKKLNAEEFKIATGWEKQSNQHERDAAMIAWNFRNAKV